MSFDVGQLAKSGHAEAAVTLLLASMGYKLDFKKQPAYLFPSVNIPTSDSQDLLCKVAHSAL